MTEKSEAMSDLQSLIERVEKAMGPDREIDGLLDQFIGDMPADARFDKPDAWGERHGTWASGGFGNYQFFDPPDYTASIDAALSLVARVLPGWSYGITSPDNPEDDPALQRQHFSARLRKSVQIIRAHAPTPALALCLALLRAVSTVQAKNEAPESDGQ